MEHFFGTLKVESGYNDLLKTSLLSYEETKKLIDDFIYYYNNERIQKNLGWKTPNEIAA
ncbi:MAG: IS3 family transposase [Treponemataceae bacterium]|nr:IS3 family transposase [Treponemataceae bacterium]